MNILMALQTTASCVLFIHSKEFLPGRPETMYEIGYHLFKRMSIFVISIIITLNSFGLMIIYNIIFGSVMAGLVQNLSHQEITEHDFWGAKATYCVALTLILCPLVL